MLSGFSGLPMG